jgi:hypothetical protein
MRHRWAIPGAVLGAMLFALLSCSALALAGETEQGFTPIFDGKTLDGWEGNPELWRVEDGTITGQTTAEKPIKGNTFLIWRQGEVDDFEIRFDYRFTSEWGNSGVQYRSFEDTKAGKWVVGGYQADCEAGDSYSGILYGERYRGILALRGKETVIEANHKPKVVREFGDTKVLGKVVKKGQWNSYRIVAKGFHFTHEINGQLMSACTDEDAQVRRRSGIVALQLHAGKPMKIQFRNIRLKRLKMDDKKKVVFVAGRPSHGYAAHAHRAGCLLLARLLNENVPQVQATVYHGGWPKDPTAFDHADAIVLFSDGGAGNPVIPHLKEVDQMAKRGVGLAFLHYAVEVPKGEAGERFLDWMGGYFETFWSVNPHFKGEFKNFAQHPVTRGVKPFAVDDEWYYHMRFRENMEGVTPVLTCVPPDSTRTRPDGPHSNNPTVRAGKGMPEHVGWARQRPDGGRGFGFTGGHWHWNWANQGFRTVVLNGIVWVAGLDVPAGGVCSKTPTLEELEANQDYPQPPKFDREKIRKMIQEWSK